MEQSNGSAHRRPESMIQEVERIGAKISP